MRRPLSAPLENWHTCFSAIALIALAAVSAATASAQTSDAPGRAPDRILGVFDARTGAPMAGVQARDAWSGTYALTTATGNVRLSFLTFRGTVAVLELRKLGYQLTRILLDRADTASLTEVMEPVVELAPVITTEHYRIDRDAGERAGFEQRCQSTSVTCFRSEDLEMRPTANLADFLIHAAGVTIGACGAAAHRDQQCGKIAMRSTQIPPSYCQPTFFVDGFEWNPRVGNAADLTPNTPAQAPYTPTNVKAIEVYSSERTRPLRFAGDATCGVVVIWTK